MAATGHVTKSQDGNFKGALRTLAFKAPVTITLNTTKTGDTQPDYRVFSNNVEIGAGWIKTGQASGEADVSLPLADPSFGPKRLCATRAAPPAKTMTACSPSSGARQTN